VLIRILVQPRASKTEISGPHGNPSRLRIRLAAPPVDGEANLELLSFLAKTIGVAKSQLSLVRGHKGKQKDVLCLGKKFDEIFKLLI